MTTSPVTDPADSWLVVGAGSAGSVVAARLSEDGRRQVTLLDAGPDLVAGHVPAGIESANFFDALEVPDRTFGDLVATHGAGSPPKRYLRGRGVGGSSAVNAMVTLRGDDELYRSWGWLDVADDWHRAELPTETPSDAELGAVDRALLATAPDAVRAPLARRDGVRVTAAETMLWPARDRPNLTIRAETEVGRVLLRGRTAVGVETSSGATFHADRVVVCAGSIHSPALLLRSGIDTPGVGEHLQDHPSAPLTLMLRPDAVAQPSDLVVGSLLTRGALQYLPMNHLGPSAAGMGLLMVALMRPHGSAGTVRIDRDGGPIVDFALLGGGGGDLEAMTDGVRVARTLLASAAFDEIVEQVYVDAFGTPLATLRDDDAIARWLATAVGDYVHASSSCAMGTVVDELGAVVGYDHLHVCDASVFPSIPDVNTHGPTTMLAERLVARWIGRAVTPPTVPR